MLFICINLLSVLDLFLCLLTIAISFVLLLLHSGFVLSVLNIIHVLDLESVWFQIFIQCITLDMFYILFIIIVDSWNVNKISYHIPYHYINQLYPTHRTFDKFLNHKRWSKSTRAENKLCCTWEMASGMMWFITGACTHPFIMT